MSESESARREPNHTASDLTAATRSDGLFSDQRKRRKVSRNRLVILFRAVTESVSCLIVAVVILRMFLIEGYIISTGSMAPNLLGYHKQAKCPACEHEFAFGVAFDQESMQQRSQLTSCPNCGQPSLTLANVPRNDGDQLLVFKNAYAFRDPRRWEIVVFMNPSDPSQAYVKRVAGLPGDQIQIIGGDVFIDGQRQQKSIEIQRAMRILVFDQTQPIRSRSWIPRWVPDGHWKPSGQTFVLGKNRHSLSFNNAEHVDDQLNNEKQIGADEFQSSPSAESLISWVNYMHWPRLPPNEREASINGAVSLRPFPIADRYGYNPLEAQPEQTPVNDLMLEARISLPLLGQFITVLRAQDELVVCLFDRAKGSVEAWVCHDSIAGLNSVLSQKLPALISAPLPTSGLDDELHLEVSAFDQRIVVTLNQKTLITQSFEELATKLAADTKSQTQQATVGGKITQVGHSTEDERPRRNRKLRTVDNNSAEPAIRRSSLSPVRFGAIGNGVRVRSVKVFRDVHYTSRESQHATRRPLELADDEFFFLGDNSPVSFDSRSWRDPVVRRNLIVGKPMVVHLPSRPARLQIGSWVRHVRVPNFSRMRVIR